MQIKSYSNFLSDNDYDYLLEPDEPIVLDPDEKIVNTLNSVENTFYIVQRADGSFVRLTRSKA